MRLAITRKVSPDFRDCELSHRVREPIDEVLASRQHQVYEQSLVGLGCEVLSLPPEPELPDSVFVEDTAVVFDDFAIITRPGAESRRAETESIAQLLLTHKALRHIESPGTLDGGDVLVVGQRVFVGRSSRSNVSGIEQVRTILKPSGYELNVVEVKGCLHLKSAVTMVGEGTLLINRNRVDAGAFDGLKLIDVDPSEPDGANALLVGETVLFPSAYPATHGMLAHNGISVLPLELSELIKAEGAVTCCSLIFAL
ncbi:dimethylarginine dimethylaminohydrolase family protein [Acidobacteriota bacterium]